MFKLLISAVALLALAGGVAYWVYGQVDDGAEAGVEVIRWVNVTLEVAEDSGLRVTRDFGPTGAVIAISAHERRGSGIGIDAATGEIIKDATKPEDRAAIDAVLETLTVSPLDPMNLPWPYGGDTPNVPREKMGNVSFVPPDPSAGIRITWGIADPGGVNFIEVNNGRSLVFMAADTGAVVWEPDFLVPEDREMLERFLSAIEYVGPAE